MGTIRWLHLSDLHQGMNQTSFLWPQVEHIFLLDLEAVHRRLGHIDLLLFTGDLTQRGTEDEFKHLGRTLGRIYARLRQLGSAPIFLAVPGNHDLTRPSPRDPTVRMMMREWHEDRDLRDEFFREPGSTCRQVVERCFANYVAFMRSAPFPTAKSIHPGLLPGEFAAALEIGGVSLGVLGLNTAFLQLTEGDFQGRLALYPQQFHAPCGGDGPSFCAGNHLNLLMTHHPPAWLSEAARRDLYGEIAPPGRFAAHLCGHMHENSGTTLAVLGSPPVRSLQTASLFGLEACGEGGLSRSHGYSAGRIEVDARRGLASLRLWPRRAVRDPHGPWRIIPDYLSFDLDDDHGTRPEVMRLSRSAAGATSGPALAPPRPGGPYLRDLHVRRQREEQQALRQLESAAAPLLLWGARGCGKSWLLAHLISLPAGGALACSLDLGEIVAEQQGPQDLDEFARRFAARLCREAGGDAELLGSVWSGPGGAGTKLGRLLRRLISPERERFLLAIDRADAIFGMSFEDEFFGFLRSWVEDMDEPFSKLRLCMCLSATPALLTKKRTQSPLLNCAIQIHLDDFTPDQVQELIARNGQRGSRRDVQAVMSLCGGNPYLLQLALHKAHLLGLALRELAEDEEVTARVFAEHLEERAAWLLGRRDLLGALRAMLDDPRGPMDANHYEHLHRAGMVDCDEEEGYRVRYKLYDALIRKVCMKP